MKPLLLSAAVLSLSSSACTRAASSREGARAPEPSPATLRYAVTADAANGPALIEGRTSFVSSALKFQTMTQDGASTALELRRHLRDDGTFDVEALYVESSAQRRTIKWNPVVHLARGATAAAKVTGDGFARELKLTVE